jgi:hypothetical protein
VEAFSFSVTSNSISCHRTLRRFLCPVQKAEQRKLLVEAGLCWLNPPLEGLGKATIPPWGVVRPPYLCSMNLNYKHLLPDNFSGNSRVWIYQSSRLFTLSESLEIESLLNKFSAEWRSHGAEVDAYANLFFGQFVVLMVDESRAGVSGCSTDSSVRFIKSIGEQFKVDFFNRTQLAFYVKNKIQLLPMSQLTYAIQNHFIDGNTLYFNNLVQNKIELEESWIVPIKNSWLGKKLHLPEETRS